MRDVQLEATVCAATDTTMGVVILQDATDTELFEFSGGIPELSPGDKIRIDRKRCLLRRRDMGVEASVLPVVDNNGIHARSTSAGGIGLGKGRHELTVEWFNRAHRPSLEVKWQIPGSESEEIPITNLFCSVSEEGSVEKTIRPGLSAECYEGDWERIPNFDLLKPVKSAIVTNFDLGVATRDDLAGVRFRGFFNAPVDGVYGFSTRSADGSLLFVDELPVPIRKVGKDVVPSPVLVTIDEPLKRPTKQGWVTVEGRVDSVSSAGRGLEMTLYAARNSLLVRIADAQGLAASNVLNSRVRVTGMGCNLFNLQGEAMLGQVFAANKQGVEIVGPPTGGKSDAPLLTKARQVQTLTLDEAKRQQPVLLRGVVTSKGAVYDNWLSLQDDTRGIFVKLQAGLNRELVCGDYYEVIGTSGAGDFAPIVFAEKLVRLGKGEFPKPIQPTWSELNNGGMDVQWVEFNGLVTGVRSNRLSMLLPAGQLDVQIEGPASSSLKALEKAVVRIRGVLFAEWNSAREVRGGSILMRNANIAVDAPPPADPFDAVLKTPRELLLFDAQTTAFRRVKVRGQIVYVDSTQAFLQEKGEGLRLLPANTTNLKPGDLVEAVGYLNINQTAIVLREAVIQKTGEAGLPPAINLDASWWESERLDSTRVRIEGRLLGWHFEQGSPVLQMQSGTHLYMARIAQFDRFPLRAGSELAMDGVFVTQGRTWPAVVAAGSFELLLNSPKDILVLSQPSWWTLGRLLILVGILVAILIASALWITQLRRLVGQRTAQLHREIHERELAEQQRAIEAERSRIARDLHDDLGASLTEIAVLASKAQRANSLDEDGQPPLRTIASKARESVGALDTIVWAVDPKDNSLQSVADYLCDFTEEYLSPSGIACRFDVPVALPVIVLEGRLRHDLFLAVKETLNNIVRHAEATEVEFRLAVANDRLEIVIVDNGKGFDATSPPSGKGQRGLLLRLSQMGGSYEVGSTLGKETVVRIGLRLPAQKIKHGGR